MRGLNDRQRMALEMRRDGKTFRAIGQTLGVGGQRAAEIYRAAMRETRHSERVRAAEKTSNSAEILLSDCAVSPRSVNAIHNALNYPVKRVERVTLQVTADLLESIDPRDFGRARWQQKQPVPANLGRKGYDELVALLATKGITVRSEQHGDRRPDRWRRSKGFDNAAGKRAIALIDNWKAGGGRIELLATLVMQLVDTREEGK